MPEQSTTTDPRWIMATIRRWLWLIIVCALLAGLSAQLVMSRQLPVYKASVTLLVQPASRANVSDYQAILTSERMARTYSQMLTSRAIMQAVIDRLGLDETPARLAASIKVELIQDTQLMRLNVEHHDPLLAATIANTTAEVFVQQINALQIQRYDDSLASTEAVRNELLEEIDDTQARIDDLGTPETPAEQTEVAHLETLLASYRNTYTSLLQNDLQMRLMAAQSNNEVVITETAQPPPSPLQNRRLYVALAALVGLLVAAGLSFAIEYLDDTIRTPEDVRQTTGLHNLGTIGRIKESCQCIVATQPRSPHVEAFYTLATNVRFAEGMNKLRTLLVTSPSMGDGKSTIAANIAAALAQAGLRVILVDANLRRPSQSQIFGIDPQAGGLAKALQQGNADGLLQRTTVEGLSVLPSDEPPGSPIEVLAPQPLTLLLEQFSRQAEFVVIDAPPVFPVADALLLARQVDGVLLVLKAGETRKQSARQAVEFLQQVGANLIGTVINAVPMRSRHYVPHRHRITTQEHKAVHLPLGNLPPVIWSRVQATSRLGKQVFARFRAEKGDDPIPAKDL